MKQELCRINKDKKSDNIAILSSMSYSTKVILIKVTAAMLCLCQICFVGVDKLCHTVTGLKCSVCIITVHTKATIQLV